MYSLGSVPDDGYIKSACAYGSFYSDANEGVVYVLVINNSDKKMRDSVYKVKVININPPSTKLCINRFDNVDHPKKGDRITVYIPQNPHADGKGDDRANQPLQINFYNNNSRGNEYQFLERSAIHETNFQSIRQGVKSALELPSWKYLKDINSTLDLNIQVRFISKRC